MVFAERFGRLCFVFLAISAPAFSQGGFGTIAGRVLDPNGGLVPKAALRATNIDTGISAEATSDGTGLYQFVQLIPGRYNVRAEAPGFKRLERKDIRVQVADRVTLDLTLEVGAPAETITVTAEATALRTQDAQTGEVVSRSLIRDLPQLQRDPLRLLTIAGNLQGDGSRAEPGSDTRINGGRTIGVEYIIDGVSAGTGLGHNVVRTTPDDGSYRGI